MATFRQAAGAEPGSDTARFRSMYWVNGAHGFSAAPSPGCRAPGEHPVWSFRNPRRRRRTAQVFLTSRKVSSCHEVHPTRDKILRRTGCTHAEDVRAAQSRDFETGLCLPAPATTGPPVHARDGYQQLESGTSRRLVGSGEVDGAQGHAVLGNRLLSPGRTPDYLHSNSVE